MDNFSFRFSLDATHLGFEIGPLTEPGTHLVGVAGWSESPRDPFLLIVTTGRMHSGTRPL